MHYKYTSISKTGFRREENEDAVGIFEVDGGILAIVCDGLGGNNAGEVASRLSVETISNSFIKSESNDYLERISDALQEANDIIFNKSLNSPHLKGMATTAEVLFIYDTIVYWGHIGDSRIYLLEGNKFKQLTKDHSLVQKLMDDGVLTLKDAESHPNKNIITRALGDSALAEIDLSELKINANDSYLFMACTDGVTTEVSNEELKEILTSGNLERISEKLSLTIENRGAPDNYSFVLISRNE
jgi:serine/threonine protein phosphatase PrpC